MIKDILKSVRKGIIYKATSPSGKVYIGQTVRSLEERKGDHRRTSHNVNRRTDKDYDTAFHRAIRKYGIDNFIWEVLLKDVEEHLLDEQEIEQIAIHDSYKNGLNETLGGKSIYGYRHKQQCKDKMSRLRKGVKRPNINKKGPESPFYGKKQSKEHIRKLSEARRGKKKSDEFKKKISNATKGDKNPFYGKKHPEEFKRRISDSRKGQGNPAAKLTWEVVEKIRTEYSKENISNLNLSYKEVGKIFGVCDSVISNILNNKTWVKSENSKK